MLSIAFKHDKESEKMTVLRKALFCIYLIAERIAVASAVNIEASLGRFVFKISKLMTAAAETFCSVFDPSVNIDMKLFSSCFF